MQPRWSKWSFVFHTPLRCSIICAHRILNYTFYVLSVLKLNAMSTLMHNRMHTFCKWFVRFTRAFWVKSCNISHLAANLCCHVVIFMLNLAQIQRSKRRHDVTQVRDWNKKMGIATRGPVAICLVIEPWGSHHLSKFGLGEWFALLLPSLVLWHTTRRGHRPCPSCPRCLSAILCLQQAHWCRWNVWDNYKALIIRLYWGLLTSIIPISPDCGVTFSSQWKFGRWVQSIKHLSRLFAISQSKHSLVTLIIEHSCGKSPYVL